ncbi:hypothetical protein CLAFUW4_08312 [Fulvia fulva]|uniref:Uncharacterized protein n=1 Tax=Passalora fulva TaxID=5499 RepID=A0A9Q8P6A8_PASFU|nr:uncharacterized protein CLAFUR5_08420 [Fulvia fulva]KAK4629643.1 hypothetical protein CLAFUR4_08317 [Fulvia fulva]KAK4629767.1 hypothetical protein CLAFUR0_08312 [Fulvia fulva]UJO14848.1 hypothetical protein CLAFUR5_08420 [Fulvia fulva]WPV12616.1 hypothetical protein CLAFUW4_08312 [Fulvia fulva]WPV27397.1 hypothetical protein CLAFUW7_08312 [Fulvia fulva]
MVEEGLLKITPGLIQTLQTARANSHYLRGMSTYAAYPHVDRASRFQVAAGMMVSIEVRAMEHEIEPFRTKYWKKSVLVLPHDFPAGEVLNHFKAQFECVADTDFDANAVYSDIAAAAEDSIGSLPEHSHRAGEAFDVIAVAGSMSSKDDAWLARKQLDRDAGWGWVCMQHCVVLEGSGWDREEVGKNHLVEER